jgi:hypothetical protein
MTLELTLKEAQVWEDIRTGAFRNQIYKRSPESIAKDREIARLLEKGEETEYIRKTVRTSRRRIERVDYERRRGLL